MEQDALSIYLSGGDKDKLLKSYAELQGTIASSALSMQLKNTNFDGEASKGGTVTVRRMQTSLVKDYGTARGNSAGDKLTNNGVDVKIDTDKEIVEELERKDIQRYGIPALVEKRVSNHAVAMTVALDKAYFKALQSGATLFDVSSESTVEDKALALIRHLEAVENSNVETVDRELMVLTLAPKWYDALEKYTHTLPNILGQDVKQFHRVEVKSAPRQEFDAIVQVRGSVAQPVTASPYAPERIPLSDAIGVSLFFYYGTKVVMPDLVFASAFDADISA